MYTALSMPTLDPSLTNLIFPVLLGLLFLFIIREIIAWYFKINKVVRLLERIEENTRPGGAVKSKEPAKKKPAASLFVSYQDQGVKKGFFG